jgi:hypothetical protein
MCDPLFAILYLPFSISHPLFAFHYLPFFICHPLIAILCLPILMPMLLLLIPAGWRSALRGAPRPFGRPRVHRQRGRCEPAQSGNEHQPADR